MLDIIPMHYDNRKNMLVIHLIVIIIKSDDEILPLFVVDESIVYTVHYTHLITGLCRSGLYFRMMLNAMWTSSIPYQSYTSPNRMTSHQRQGISLHIDHSTAC